MATFNFHKKVNARDIVGRDAFYGADRDRVAAIEALTGK